MTQSSTITDAALVRIGTRGSPLALAQAHEVQRGLAAAHRVAPDRIAIVVIRTSGDAIQDRPLSEAGGKGLFTKEIEDALLAGRVDLAVHSCKDVPTFLPDGLVLSTFLEREDPRDVFLSPRWKTVAALPQGAVIGTASLRRQAMIKRLRPDVNVINFRGNVETRLRKLESGEVDATLLALAGLKRLGLAESVLGSQATLLDPEKFIPAVGQGAIAIETRADDTRTGDLLAPLNHADTADAVVAERAFLAVLDGSCRTPIGGHAIIAGDHVTFRGIVLRPDGTPFFEATRTGARSAASALAADAGHELKDQAGPDFFKD